MVANMRRFLMLCLSVLLAGALMIGSTAVATAAESTPMTVVQPTAVVPVISWIPPVAQDCATAIAAVSGAGLAWKSTKVLEVLAGSTGALTALFPGQSCATWFGNQTVANICHLSSYGAWWSPDTWRSRFVVWAVTRGQTDRC